MLKSAALKLVVIVAPSIALTFQATNYLDEKAAIIEQQQEDSNMKAHQIEITMNDRRAEATYEPLIEEPKEEVINMEITGYTAGYESTGKHPGHPAYGLTTSGAYVKQGVTVAAGQNVPFGTKIYIPYFDGKPGFGDGIFTVQDRGGAIGAYNIDVYFEQVHHANEFGRQLLEVKILED